MSDTGSDGSFRVREITRPFPNLVALHVRWPGNRVGRRFPLNLLLEVEEYHLAIPTPSSLIGRISQNLSKRSKRVVEYLRLRVRLRHCYVRYRSEEIEVIGDSKYESVILEGNYEIKTTKTMHVGRKMRLGSGATAQLKTQPTNTKAVIGLQASALFSYKQNRHFDETTEAIPDIFEVQAVPNGWRIGHPEYGDPNKPSGYLDGRYFDKAVVGYPQTCEAEFLEAANVGALIFTVTVRDGLQVERLDGRSASHEEKTRAETAMRDRIAALRIERHLESGAEAADDELTLARVVCDIVRAADDEIAAPGLSRAVASSGALEPGLSVEEGTRLRSGGAS